MAHGIRLKKEYGQHFLRDERYAHSMAEAISLDGAQVLEIGCGDGFLTRVILQHPVARLWTYEIDQEWARYVRTNIVDTRLTVIERNFLDENIEQFEAYSPWIVLANLPYYITFPIVYRFQEYRHVMPEGVIMIQEDVAQKIVKTSGRDYGFHSLFLQHYFSFKLLDKVPPSAFYPPPKVFSRLLYFKAQANQTIIPDETLFWRFIKHCFHQFFL
jgi:16S rRNA (adenine1518-N6/adenine1519-N6)-dimethyltransferase